MALSRIPGPPECSLRDLPAGAAPRSVIQAFPKKTPSMSEAAMYIYSYRNLVAVIYLTYRNPVRVLNHGGDRAARRRRFAV